MINNVVVQIPCLNEESTIGDVVRGFKKNFLKQKLLFTTTIQQIIL